MLKRNGKFGLNNDDELTPWYSTWFFFVFLMIAISTIWYLYRGPLGPDSDLSRAGQLGDMYGSLNTLFSGYAFAGLIWAILLQKIELRASNIAFRRTAQSQEQSLEILRKQIDAAEKREDRDLSPVFVEYTKTKNSTYERYSSIDKSIILAEIENIGGLARNIEITSDVGGDVRATPRGVIRHNGQVRLKHALPDDIDGLEMKKEKKSILYFINCEDARGARKKFVLCYDLNRNEIYEQLSQER